MVILYIVREILGIIKIALEIVSIKRENRPSSKK